MCGGGEGSRGHALPRRGARRGATATRRFLDATAFLRWLAPPRRLLERLGGFTTSICTRGLGGVELPGAIGRKYPNAGSELSWQWVFPATRRYVHPGTHQRRRHHLHETVVQRAVSAAVRLG